MIVFTLGFTVVARRVSVASTWGLTGELRELASLTSALPPSERDRSLGGWRVHRRSVERYMERPGLLMPGMLRKASWQLLITCGVPREVARFIHSRYGELRVSEAHYEDLVRKADHWYPKYLQCLRSQNLIPAQDS